MKKTSVLLSLAFVLVFAAGFAMGVVSQQRHKPPRDFGAFLAEKLKLTSDQQNQMKAIWSNAMSSDKSGRSKYQELRDQRDAAINALLQPSQVTEYQAINDTYKEQFNKLRQSRRDAIDKAVAQTRKILTAQQIELYDKLRPQNKDGWRKPPYDHGPDHGPNFRSGQGAPPEPGTFGPDHQPHDDASQTTSSTSNGEQQ
jgi:Spy/CpxP family protein refolding chaperone